MTIKCKYIHEFEYIITTLYLGGLSSYNPNCEMCINKCNKSSSECKQCCKKTLKKFLYIIDNSDYVYKENGVYKIKQDEEINFDDFIDKL